MAKIAGKISDEPTEDAALGPARASLGARVKAWWSGEEAVPAAANDAGDADSAGSARPGGTDKDSADEDSNAAAAGAGAPSLKARLKAWWDGTEATPPAEGEGDGKDGVGAGPARAAPVVVADIPDIADQTVKSAWPSERIAAAERIWGAGFAAPGGVELAVRLTKPFALDKSKTMLELGSGLGGNARAIATEFDSWVTGYERDPTLAAAAMETSRQHGLGKRAVIRAYDHKAFLADTLRFDALFSKEALFRFPEKSELFTALPGKLKDRAQVVITDLVLAAPGATDPALEAWIRDEAEEPHPWTAEQYVSAATKVNLDVRVNEDLTDEYLAMVRDAWRGLEAVLKPGVVDAAAAAAILDEGANWQRRAAALASGKLRLIRLHMVKR